MESLRSRVAALLLLNVVLLILSVPAALSDEEDNLLQGINSFRQASNVPPLAKHDRAECIADEIANQLEDTQCGRLTPQNLSASNYPKALSKCKVDVNTTAGGLILPVCVPHRVATLVLTNYTHSPRTSRYLNNSMFTGAGIGTEDDWTVLVLTTAGTGGSFASGAGCRLCQLPWLRSNLFYIVYIFVVFASFV